MKILFDKTTGYNLNLKKLCKICIKIFIFFNEMLYSYLFLASYCRDEFDD